MNNCCTPKSNSCTTSCNTPGSKVVDGKLNVFPVPRNQIGGDIYNCNNQFLLLNKEGKGFDITSNTETLLQMLLNNFFVPVDGYSVNSITLPPQNIYDEWINVAINPDTDFIIIYPDYGAASGGLNSDQNAWWTQFRFSNSELDKQDQESESESESPDLYPENICNPVAEQDETSGNSSAGSYLPGFNSSQTGVSFVPASRGCCGDRNNMGNCDGSNNPSDGDKQHTQFIDYTDYNMLNRIFVSDIPKNMFDTIQLRNCFFGQNLPVKILQVVKRKV